MVNSIRAMADIIARMPKDAAPETTEGYEPYIHPYIIDGEEARTTLKVLLRDFHTAGLEVLKKKIESIIADVRPLHPKAKIDLQIIEQYRNMEDFMGSDTRLLDIMWEATKRAGLEPKWVPIRGGTDGSRLTEKGLPTPNLFTGGQNYHGPTEWLSVQGMQKSVETVLHIAQLWAEMGSA
jgi:tripeptide aminopeptidase